MFGGGGGGFSKKKIKLPKPSQPLKSFNWAKLPDAKLRGTIWSDLDESGVVPFLEFSEIDDAFSAYQKKENKDEVDASVGPVSKETAANTANKPKELAFIDNNRSRNCEIILKKINMNNDEIVAIVISMDQEEKLSKDMVEQMLKIIPQQEENNLFSSHVADIELFARADRYLYEMSKIPRFEQRLKALYYKKCFGERIGEIKPKIECLIRSCKQVTRSKRLRTLLEVILVFGNYMNKGSRGNASGFKLSSLNKAIDTKSSADRRVTLLHFIIELLSQKFPLVFDLEEELADIRSASKINPTELGQELGFLRKGITQLEDELTYQNGLSRKDRVPHDRFVEVVGNFTKISKFSIQEVEELAEEMKEKVKKVLLMFGEDTKSVTSDEFFGTLSTFLTSFSEAKSENVAMKKQKEEEEKKARNLAEQKVKDRQRSVSKKLTSENQTAEDKRKSLSERSPGEFDDLISALRTGDVFGDEISAKGGRKRLKSRQMSVTAPNKMSIIGDRDRSIDSKAIANLL